MRTDKKKETSVCLRRSRSVDLICLASASTACELASRDSACIHIHNKHTLDISFYSSLSIKLLPYLHKVYLFRA